MDKELDNIKKLLSSLIISSARGLTARRLLQDYRSEIGADVPFRRYGHHSFDSFLHSLPDVCRLHGYGPDAMVEPVVNEKVKHINEMIKKQKRPKYSRAGRLHYPRPTGVEIRPPPKVDYSKIHLPKLVPDGTKVIGLPPADYHLDQIHQRQSVNTRNNQQVYPNFSNKKYTQPNTFSYQQNTSQPNTFSYQRNTSQPNNFSYQQNTFSYQQNTSQQNTFSYQRNTSQQNTFSYQQNTLVTNQLTTRKEPVDVNNKVLSNQNNCVVTNTIENKNENDNIPSNTTITKETETNPKSEEEYYDPETCYEKEETRSLADECCSELYFSDNSLDDLVYNSDEEIFEEAYEKQKDKTEKSSTNSCKSSSQNSETNERLTDCPLERTMTAEEIKIASRVSDHVKKNLKILITEHEDGIWCSKLLEYYNRRFKEKLDPFNFGFSSVSQMCEILSDIFHIIRPGKGDWKVFDRSKPKPNAKDIEEWIDYIKKFHRPVKNTIEIAPFPADMSDCKVKVPVKYPENIVPLGVVIETQDLPSDVKIKEYIDIIISEVYDPSKFWFQLKSEITKLNQLMDELQLFYNVNGQEYKMDIHQVQEELYCAAIILGEYHRGIIVKVFDDGTVKIFFIDYGTVSDVNIKRVFFLHEQFGYLPRQAIRARLSNIKPKAQNTMWPRTAGKRFLEMITDKELVGYITFIDYENYTLYFIVTDVTKENVDIHINDSLVDEGFGVIGNKAEICATSRAIVANVHLYPTFDEIENGITPNVADLDKLEKLGFQYEQIFSDYFVQINKHVDYNDRFYCSPELDSINNSLSEMTLDDQETSQDNTDASTETNNNEESSTEVESVTESNIESDKLFTVKPQLDVNPNIQTNTEDISLQDQVVYESQSACLNVNAPPGFALEKINEITPDQQKNNLDNIVSLLNVLNSFQMYIVKNATLYPQEIIQIIYLHLSNCYDILKIMGASKDLTEISMLSRAYVEKVKIIKDLISNAAKTDTPGFYPYSMLLHDVKTSEMNIISDECNYLTSEINSSNLQEMQNVPTNFSPKISDKKEETESLTLNNTDSVVKTIKGDCFKIGTNNFKIHIMRIEGDFYMSTQEVISSLLESKQLFSNWTKNYSNSLPSRVVNLQNFIAVYEASKDFDIPGVQANNNLGCYVRVTPIKRVPLVVKILGRREIYEDIVVIVKTLESSKN